MTAAIFSSRPPSKFNNFTGYSLAVSLGIVDRLVACVVLEGRRREFNGSSVGGLYGNFIPVLSGWKTRRSPVATPRLVPLKR